MSFLNVMAVVQAALLLAILIGLNKAKGEIMATIADLDAEIAGDLADAATAIETALAAALANVTVPVDVQPQIDHIKAITAAMKTAAAGSTPTVVVPPAP